MKKIMKKNPKVSIILREDKIRKDDTCPIYYVVRYVGRNFKFSTEYACKKSNWDAKKSLPKDSRVTNILERKKIDFDNWVIARNVTDRAISLELIKDYFNGNEPDNFFTFYEQFIEENGKNHVENTLKGYRSNLHVIQEFQEEINIDDIDIKFIERFDRYLRHDRNLTNGGRFGHHKCLKAILNRAVKEKRIKENPYKEHEFEIPQPGVREIFLNEKDLLALEKLKIAATHKGLIRTKQMFLFSCYTGLRYSDIVTLEWKQIQLIEGRKFIVKEQKKTKKKVTIPLSDKALAILNMRKGVQAIKVFDDVTNQKLNYNLKDICLKAKIHKKVTFHIARHTFASVAVGRNKNIYMVSKIMGHSKLSQTEKYAKLNQSILYEVVEI